MQGRKAAMLRLILKPHQSLVAVALAGVLLTTTSCGGDDESSSGGTTTTTTTTTVPGAPTIGAATVGDGSASIAFTAPSSNGGSAITGYTASCAATGQTTRTGTGTASPISVTSLTNGTAYSCSVTATNAVGTSAASGTVSVTPAAAVTALPAAFGAFGANVKVVFNASAGTVSLEAAGRPDHQSTYWDAGNASGLYVAPTSVTTVSAKSPGDIEDYTNKYYLTVSANPIKASSTTATSLGAIGIAVTGAPIFNQSEGPTNLNAGTISGFDLYGAHTGPQVYHYHTELTPYSENDEKLIAILRDGFFLYGRKCASTGANPTDLDASNGHTSTTQYNTTAIYHYHIKNTIYLTVNGKANYILFDGAYQGTPASITN